MTFCPSLQLILGGRVGWKCESFHTYWPKSPLIRRCVKREQDIWNLKQLWERWWSTDVLPKFDVVRSTRHWLIGAPLKRAKKICSVINNSVKNYWSLLKVGTSMHCGSQRQTRLVIKPRMNVGPAASSGNVALIATFLGHHTYVEGSFWRRTFCYPTFNLPDRQTDLHQKYIRGWVLGLAQKTDRHFANPSFNLYRDQEYEIKPDFRL